MTMSLSPQEEKSVGSKGGVPRGLFGGLVFSSPSALAVALSSVSSRFMFNQLRGELGLLQEGGVMGEVFKNSAGGDIPELFHIALELDVALDELLAISVVLSYGLLK
jgi:hypothetical protein